VFYSHYLKRLASRWPCFVSEEEQGLKVMLKVRQGSVRSQALLKVRVFSSVRPLQLVNHYRPGSWCLGIKRP
jgi:hypothetical protein